MADEKTEVDNIEKNIDLAIEAQDGKVDTPTISDTETPSGEEADKTGEVKQPEDSASGASDDKSQQPAKDEAGKKAEQRTHGSKDLTLADGTVVKGGPERRFYEQRELARQREQAAVRERDHLHQQYVALQEKYTQLDNSIKGVHGVDANQLRLGVNIVRDLQKDPVGTLKKLLAEATAQGYTVDDIGAGVDIAAIEERIVSRLLQESQNNAPVDDATIEREALTEAATFFANHPDAKPHDAFLARMLRDHPTLNLESAYYQLKEAFIDKGFDWNLTLDENVKQMGGDPATTGQPNQQQQKAPLPEGGNGGSAAIKTADVVGLGADDMDTGDIVKQAMRESGLNI